MPSQISEKFIKVINDFMKDILITFPEYKHNLNVGLADILENKQTEEANNVFIHCQQVYPEKFFDILYQNDDIFNNEIFFLPNIDFNLLWKQNISGHTRTVIWKYLQLVLFTVINLQEDGESFGNTAKMFEAINEKDLKNKLKETIEQMSEIFNKSDGDTTSFDISGLDKTDLPDPEQLRNHISDMLDGNLGKLAKEIAEETANEINMDMEDVTSIEDVFKKLFTNPGKLMSLVKKVGNKLDSKLNSGEIKESELMEEASKLMTKMHDMPSMKSMLSKMGLPTGKKSNINMGAFQAHLARNMKNATTRERLQKKLQRKREKLEKEKEKVLQMDITVDPPKKKKKRRRKKRKGRNKK